MLTLLIPNLQPLDLRFLVAQRHQPLQFIMHVLRHLQAIGETAPQVILPEALPGKVFSHAVAGLRCQHEGTRRTKVGVLQPGNIGLQHLPGLGGQIQGRAQGNTVSQGEFE